MNGRFWKIVVGTAVALALIVIVAGLAFMYSGAYDISATSGHGPVSGWVLATTADRSISARAGSAPPPPPFDSSLAADGFRQYREECQQCHGAPGVKPDDLGKGVDPEPPDLSHDISDLSQAELFWITKHGIKFTGMPAFGPTHSDHDLWGIVAFLRQLEKMTPAEYARWQARYPRQGEHREGSESGKAGGTVSGRPDSSSSGTRPGGAV